MPHSEQESLIAEQAEGTVAWASWRAIGLGSAVLMVRALLVSVRASAWTAEARRFSAETEILAQERAAHGALKSNRPNLGT